MLYIQYMSLLLLAKVALADYYIDNANSTVDYAMAPSSQSGQTGWQTFSVSTRSLELSITNSTGNYTILLDASHCYDQNYAREPSPSPCTCSINASLSVGVCGVGDNCYVKIPFTGSGITMYVFNAGASGMTASFAVDNNPAVSNSINAPPGPTFQVSNVSLYDVQGLPSGNHTMVMTVLDWEGSPTSMKFDYAYVNESFVAAPVTTSSTSSVTSTSTSQTPSQTSAENLSGSKKTNVGAIVGGTLGGVIAVASIVIGLLYFRRRKARQQNVPSAESTFQVNPFVSDLHRSPTPPVFTQLPETNSPVPPLVRSAILRDALAAGTHSSPIQSPQLITPGASSLQPNRATPSTDSGPYMLSSRMTDTSPLSDSQIAQYSLTEDQLEVVGRLRADNVPLDTISRVIEGFVASHLSAGETRGLKGMREGSIHSAVPPPSYQTRAR